MRIFYLTRRQTNRSISTAAHFCSSHSEREECGYAVSVPSLCDVVSHSEINTARGGRGRKALAIQYDRRVSKKAGKLNLRYACSVFVTSVVH